jgi:hypothetical protein
LAFSSSEALGVISGCFIALGLRIGLAVSWIAKAIISAFVYRCKFRVPPFQHLRANDILGDARAHSGSLSAISTLGIVFGEICR